MTSTSTTNIFQQLSDHFGGQVKTALALDVTQPTVSNWISCTHRMSPTVALRTERKTKGLFKATDLCPELAKELAS